MALSPARLQPWARASGPTPWGLRHRGFLAAAVLRAVGAVAPALLRRDPFLPRRRRRFPPPDFGKLRSSSRATAEGLRAIRIRAPRSTSSASGVWATDGGEQRDREAAVLLAGGVDDAAGVAPVGAPRGVDEQAEQALGLGPALDRVLLVELAGDRRQAPDPGLRLVAAADPPLGERLEQHLGAGAALVARPGRHHLDRVVEGLRVAQRGDLGQRLEPQLVVAVALHAGEQEAAAQLLGLVVLEHRLRAAPVVGRHPRAGERRPGVLLGVVEVLDRDPPQLALEHGQAALGIGRDGHHAALDAHPPAAAAAHRADDDRAAAVDVAVEQAVQGDDRLVVGRRRVDEVDHQAGLLPGVRRVTRPTRCW